MSRPRADDQARLDEAAAAYLRQIARNNRNTIETYQLAVIKDWTQAQVERYIETGELPA